MGSKIIDIANSNVLSHISPQVKEAKLIKKERKKEIRLHQTKKFCTAQENMNKINS